MALYLKAEDVPWSEPTKTLVNTKGQLINCALVYGEKSNLFIGRRAPGFHSKPHKHESEQLNYCVEGGLWMYVDGVAYHLEKGDFLRIPAWSMHWAWNRLDSGNVLIEVHTPLTNPPHPPFSLVPFA